MRKAVGVVVIKNKKVLLVRKKETWILPGGKPEKTDKSDTDCLLREVQEELPLLKLRNLKYFDTFIGTTPHKGDELGAKVYFAGADGEITPNAEINAAKWIKCPEKYNLSDITQKIILSLHKKGYL